MGAWGRGLLQNDDAQDGLCEVIHLIEADIPKVLRRRPAEPLAARLAAQVGLLLHLQSWYSFNPENPWYPRLLATLQRQEPAFATLSKPAAVLLRAVLAGKGEELVMRNGKLPADVRAALFLKEGGFPMERTIGKRDDSLFAHPESARCVQELADRLVRIAHAGFRNKGIAGWLHEEGGKNVAALAVLLVIEPCRVDPVLFRQWWALFRAANAREDDAEVDEDDYETTYNRCLKQALQAGLRKFSPPDTPVSLED